MSVNYVGALSSESGEDNQATCFKCVSVFVDLLPCQSCTCSSVFVSLVFMLACDSDCTLMTGRGGELLWTYLCNFVF